MSEAEDIIQRESIQQLQRWEMPPVPGLPSAARQSEEDPTVVAAGEEMEPHTLRLPTAEELQQMVSQAEAEAKERGYAEGYAKGQEAAWAEAQEDREQLRILLQALQEPLKRIDEGVQQALVTLALEIARQVIRQELHLHPEIILPLLREALASLPGEISSPLVRLHPADLQLVRKQLGMESEADLRLEADESLDRGSIVLQGGLRAALARPDRRWQEREGAASELDLRLATRWRQILEPLFSTLDPA